MTTYIRRPTGGAMSAGDAVRVVDTLNGEQLARIKSFPLADRPDPSDATRGFAILIDGGNRYLAWCDGENWYRTAALTVIT